MCLTIYTPDYFLLPYNNYLIGAKKFAYQLNNKTPILKGVYVDYTHKFKKHEDGIIAIPNNTEQRIEIVIPLKIPQDYYSVARKADKLMLGFHIKKFMSATYNKKFFVKAIFNKFGLIEKNVINIPVLFDSDWIQLDSYEDVALETFIIPNKETYENICSYYKLQPNKDLSKLLNTLTSKIKTEGD